MPGQKCHPCSGLHTLPNPNGRDNQNEVVTIHNGTATAVNLTGWHLRDRGRNSFALSGNILAGGELRIRMTRSAMLNNMGDTIWLTDPGNVEHSRVTYVSTQAGSGNTVEFN